MLLESAVRVIPEKDRISTATFRQISFCQIQAIQLDDSLHGRLDFDDRNFAGNESTEKALDRWIQDE